MPGRGYLAFIFLLFTCACVCVREKEISFNVQEETQAVLVYLPQ